MLGDLFDRNRTTMPVGKEGSLSGQQIADITAFMLQVNKFLAGPTELPSQSMMLKSIVYLAEKPAATHAVEGAQRGREMPCRLCSMATARTR